VPLKSPELLAVSLALHSQSEDGMGRWLRPLGLEPWDWRRCWKSIDFWLAAAVLLVPFGPLLLLPLRWEPVQVFLRSRRRS
jgi:hypothetical protein